jgi:hypothetical protein
MAEQPSMEEINRWHRYFAVECNNRSWDLAEMAVRTPDQDVEMKALAFASAYHWSKVGTAVNDARANVTIAHVLATLGEGDQALVYARKCLDYFQANPDEDWDIAFAWLEVAFAASVLGDADLQLSAFRKAEELGNRIKGEEDRRIFQEELAKVPRPFSG